MLVEQGLEPIGTILCVHGNPTWSYLWRTVLDAGVNERAPWRVVAVDQIDMGYSGEPTWIWRVSAYPDRPYH